MSTLGELFLELGEDYTCLQIEAFWKTLMLVAVKKMPSPKNKKKTTQSQ